MNRTLPRDDAKVARRCVRRSAWIVAALAVGWPVTSFAEDAPSRPLPSPVLLPGLSDAPWRARADWMVGWLLPETRSANGAAVALVRPSFEYRLLPRFYLGLVVPVGSARAPDGGLAPGEAARPGGLVTALGNVELGTRTRLLLPTDLEIDFGLGVVLPTTTLSASDRVDRSVAAAATSLDPTNYVHLLAERLALRPSGDLRIVRGSFVFQGRQGIDILFDPFSGQTTTLAGRILGHVGWLASRDVEVSFEASQIYLFSSQQRAVGATGAVSAFDEKYRVRDDRRSAITLGPAIRVMLNDVEVGASIVTNVGELYSPASPRVWGFRLSLSSVKKSPTK